MKDNSNSAFNRSFGGETFYQMNQTSHLNAFNKTHFKRNSVDDKFK